MNVFRGFHRYWLAFISDRFEGRDAERALVLLYFSLLVMSYTFGFSIYYYVLGVSEGVVIDAYGGISAILLIFLLIRYQWLTLCSHLFNFTFLAFFLAFVYYTGWSSSPFIPWLTIIPFSAIVLHSRRWAIFWGMLALLGIVIWYPLEANLGVPVTNILESLDDGILLPVYSGFFMYCLVAILIYLQSRSDLSRLEEERIENQERSLKDLEELMYGQEIERERISRELHDGLNQMLTSTRIMHELAFAKHPGFEQELEALLIGLTETSEESSHLSRNLATHFLKDFGLTESIASLARMLEERYGLEIEYYCENPGLLSQRKSLQLYRLVQEALECCRLDGEASEISLQVLNIQGSLRIMVEDNGNGKSFAPDPLSGKSSSLIRDRVRILHGNLEVDCSPGKGCVLIIEIPHKYEKNKTFSRG